MLSIRTKNEPFSPFIRTWYVGDFVKLNAEEEIISVEADGDELNFIVCHFLNIPKVDHKDVMIWTGEIAKFIVDNL